jgi:uncharacterized membrane protein (UPF0127 family)
MRVPAWQRVVAGGAAVALALTVVALAAYGDGDTDQTATAAPVGPRTAYPQIIFTRADATTVAMTVEVADTFELLTCGLMYRLALPEDYGMLFVFLSDYAGSFYNRNTFIPLTLAWISAEGVILDLTDMPAAAPEDGVETFFAPAPPGTRYVLEANQGWFARNGVAVGDRVDLREPLARGSEGAVPICRERGVNPRPAAAP